jgi:nucleoside-diphosphate-sugar epimerase
MRVLFLGGTGNISTSCVEACLGRGFSVTVLNRGQRRSPFGDRVATIRGERDDPAALAAAAAGRFDVVVDFLAYRPEQVDAMVTALRGHVGQYVFISSSSAYEKPPRRHVITEETPLANPFWEYARLKIACEEALARARADGFPATVVRPGYTYGESWIPSAFGGQDYTVVDRMRRGRPVVSHGDGTGLWPMTAAADFAVGLLGLLGNDRAHGEAFHITSDEVLTWDEIYRTMARAAGVSADLVHVPSDLIARIVPERAGSLLGDKAWSTVFDNGKIRRFVPEWKAVVSFEAGMRRSVAWYDAFPARRVVSEEQNRKIDRVIAAQRRALEGTAP